MPSYTLKEGACAECGSEYIGLISDAEPHRNKCPKCKDGTAGVENAKSLRFFHFTPYFDTGMGQMVNSLRDRKAKMVANDLVDVGDYAHNENYLVDDLKSHVPKQKDEGMTEGFGDVWNEVVVNNHTGE